MIDDIRNEFIDIEKIHFELVNKYIIGIININEVNDFGKRLEEFKVKVYSCNEEEYIMEIAKIKSKIQHFYTEIMEDEELLRIAYGNM